MKDEGEYLDPEKNPMIPVYGEDADLEKVSLLDGAELAPFEIAGSTPEKIIKKLNADFPGADEIVINDSLPLTRSATGGFITGQGYPIQKLPASDLNNVAAFLAGRGR